MRINSKKRWKRPFQFVLAWGILWILFPVVTTAQNAQISESEQTIKTYPFGDPSPVPILDSKAEIYPYFRFDGYTDEANPEKWKVVSLENEYIKLSVLPEVGGKIFGATEKSTGNEFIYKNDVLKFRDIALRGPWTSGGIEFNFGYIGHTPSTATPVDYLTKENKDGSVSAFIGGLDLASRTQWRVEIRLPDSSAAFQTKNFWYNATSLNQSYYYWSNAAIHAKDDLKLYFPGTDYIGHDGQANSWPTDNKGRKVSYYKSNNFGGSKAYHVLGKYQDFAGAYWNDRDFGYSHWARHNEMPGQKIFMWALSPAGEIWENLLTDSAGQYVEVQTGRLFNQAGLSSGNISPYGQKLFQPYAADRWSEQWFPVKKTGGISEASAYGTMNVEREGQELEIALNPTKYIGDSLTVDVDGDQVTTRQIDLKPMEVYNTDVTLPTGTDSFTVALGNKLRYTYPSKDSLNRPIASKHKKLQSSTNKKFQQAEELIAIRKYDQALEMYKKVIQDSPNHRSALNRLGELYYRRAEYDKALNYVRQVLEEDTYNAYANFMYGVINKRLGRETQAKDAFGWAARSMKYRSAGFAQMAELYLSEGNSDDALYYARKALDFNTNNMAARKVKAIAYRMRGDSFMAEQELERILDIDPLSHFARFERFLLDSSDEDRNKFTSLIRNEMPDETYLEIAINYYNIGRSREAKKVLQLAPNDPIVQYWLAYLNKNDRAQSEKYLQKAVNGSPRLVFPSRSETVEVLRWALQKSDRWETKYYLGLIMWDKGRKTDAVKLLGSCKNKPNFAPFYITRSKLLKKKDPKQAGQDLKYALDLNGEQWRTYRALTEWYISQNKMAKALEVSQKAHQKFPANYYLGMRYASVLNDEGQFKQALQTLTNLQVLPFEGATKGHRLYEHAQIMRALIFMRDKEFKKALAHINKSRQWPEHLGAGRPYNPDDRFQDYLQAYINRRQDNSQEAEELTNKLLSYSQDNWKNIVTGEFTKDNFVSYLVLKDAGKSQKAETLLQTFEKELGDKKLKKFELTKGVEGNIPKKSSLTEGSFPDWLILLRKAL